MLIFLPTTRLFFKKLDSISIHHVPLNIERKVTLQVLEVSKAEIVVESGIYSRKENLIFSGQDAKIVPEVRASALDTGHLGRIQVNLNTNVSLYLPIPLTI